MWNNRFSYISQVCRLKQIRFVLIREIHIIGHYVCDKTYYARMPDGTINTLHG